MVISNYYLSLSGKVKSKFIQDVIELCDISYPSFFYKMRNDSWTKLEREAIEKFIQQKNEKSKQEEKRKGNQLFVHALPVLRQHGYI